MSSLVSGFVVRMCKRVASPQGETTLSSEGPEGKRFKQSGLAEEVQISLAVISVDSSERVMSPKLIHF